MVSFDKFHIWSLIFVPLVSLTNCEIFYNSLRMIECVVVDVTSVIMRKTKNEKVLEQILHLHCTLY